MMGGRPGCQRSKQVVLTHSQVKALTRSHPSTPQRTTLHHSMLHARTPVQLAAVSAGPTCLASCGRAATYSFTVSQLSATKPAGGEACVCACVSCCGVACSAYGRSALNMQWHACPQKRSATCHHGMSAHAVLHTWLRRELAVGAVGCCSAAVGRRQPGTDGKACC